MFDKPEEYNPKEKKTLAKFIMRFIDFFLVRNDVPFFGKIAKKTRCFLARRISKGIEKGAVIEKGAIIVPGVSCEAHACIGINCVTCWGLHIAKHTMMGSNCRFFSQPHKRALSGNYVFRGFEEPRPIYIKSDCWIGYNSIILGGGNNFRRLYDWCLLGCDKKRASIFVSRRKPCSGQKNLSYS